MVQEIIYSQTRNGVFEPVPTRAQKRQAKRAIEERKKKRQKIINALGFLLLGLFGLALMCADLWATKFYTVHWN